MAVWHCPASDGGKKGGSPPGWALQVSLSSPLQGWACLQLTTAFLGSWQHFKQLVDELQAKGVGTVNKALTESFKILREVRGSLLMLTQGICMPALPFVSDVAQSSWCCGRSWYGWCKLLSRVSNLWQEWLSVGLCVMLLNVPRIAVECTGEWCSWVWGLRRWGDISSLGPTESASPPYCCIALAHHRPGRFWLWIRLINNSLPYVNTCDFCLEVNVWLNSIP